MRSVPRTRKSSNALPPPSRAVPCHAMPCVPTGLARLAAGAFLPCPIDRPLLLSSLPQRFPFSCVGRLPSSRLHPFFSRFCASSLSLVRSLAAPLSLRFSFRFGCLFVCFCLSPHCSVLSRAVVVCSCSCVLVRSLLFIPSPPIAVVLRWVCCSLSPSSDACLSVCLRMSVERTEFGFGCGIRHIVRSAALIQHSTAPHSSAEHNDNAFSL
jgi:hypothetical protein